MAAFWQTDTELFALTRRELFVAAVGDVLDKLGFQHQFLDPRLKPIDPSMIIIGRAMPVLEADYFDAHQHGNNPLTGKPFGMLFEALDDLRRDEVYVCAGSSRPYALWGGLMSTRARQCGAAGAVVHGYHRDTNEILSLAFPVASFGSYAQDQGPRGKVLDWRIPIEMEDVRINPGDVIYGDRDGVLVVPAEVVEAAFVGAIEKVRGEKMVLTALQNGMTAAEAFRTFGLM
jgi:regulator of RNase E activity RraA